MLKLILERFVKAVFVIHVLIILLGQAVIFHALCTYLPNTYTYGIIIGYLYLELVLSPFIHEFPFPFSRSVDQVVPSFFLRWMLGISLIFAVVLPFCIRGKAHGIETFILTFSITSGMNTVNALYGKQRRDC